VTGTFATRHRLAIDIASQFSLNDEQRRAFFTLTDHANLLIAYETGERHEPPDQLALHIGGPAGTGKSWILHAWRAFFKALGLTDVSTHCMHDQNGVFHMQSSHRIVACMNYPFV
jgi:chromosomal replication initiation ATPase DnaA